MSWKPVVGYEGRYAVSDEGQVKNVKTGKTLKPGKQSRGYLTVVLFSGTKASAKSKTVHSLVLESFIGPRRTPSIDHIDGDKTNNRLDNLQYVSHRENQMRRFDKTGRRQLYRGVEKVGKRWRAQIQEKGKKYRSRSFALPEEAAEAYQEMKRAIEQEVTV